VALDLILGQFVEVLQLIKSLRFIRPIWIMWGLLLLCNRRGMDIVSSKIRFYFGS
jgi:hypothetical protein